MQFNVPQFVDIEDKVAGPLTWKQLLWMIAMGVVLLILWNILTLGAFIVVGIFVATIFVAFAFYRPYGQPLTKMAYYGVLYLFNPKIYTWKLEAETKSKKPKATKKKETPSDETPQISPDELSSIAQTLDNPEALLKNRKK